MGLHVSMQPRLCYTAVVCIITFVTPGYDKRRFRRGGGCMRIITEIFVQFVAALLAELCLAAVKRFVSLSRQKHG